MTDFNAIEFNNGSSPAINAQNLNAILEALYKISQVGATVEEVEKINNKITELESAINTLPLVQIYSFTPSKHTEKILQYDKYYKYPIITIDIPDFDPDNHIVLFEMGYRSSSSEVGTGSKMVRPLAVLTPTDEEISPAFVTETNSNSKPLNLYYGHLTTKGKFTAMIYDNHITRIIVLKNFNMADINLN